MKKLIKTAGDFIVEAANNEREAGTVIVLSTHNKLIQIGYSSGHTFEVTGDEALAMLEEFAERAELFDVSVEDAILHSAPAF